MATVRTFSSTMGDRALGKLTIVHNGQSDKFDPTDGNSTVTITGTVFEAVIGTTSYAQVYAAFQASQFVFTRYSNYIMNLVSVQKDDCKFVCVDELGHTIEATLDSDGNWNIATNRALGKLTIVHNDQSDKFDPTDGNSTVTITGTVFFATYGMTTFDQVKTARSNGCHIIARREVPRGDLYGMLKQASSSEFYFNYVDGSGNNVVWKLDDKDTWSTD